ncbi:hypothetical protein FOA52_011077 [Chlamydomonas sp. UWO 241]|nr:hypothetical protein FOA52_011077 [Chlamydomonas sp. UWO 241]
MDDGSGSEAEEMRLPLGQRPEWADVSPLEVDDGNCVVAVQYSDEHRAALSYLRAVLASGEKSARVLELTAEMIEYNQADYTAWQLRWLCVEALGADLESEEAMTDRVLHDNAKNYQLWNYRRKVALKRGPSCLRRELDFIARALELDDKNYHAWSHRNAVVAGFAAWDGELEFVDTCLKKDLRNNSAWQHRAVVVAALLAADAGAAAASTGEGGVRAAVKTVIQRELFYTSALIAKAPRNESAWNYLLGLFALPGCAKHEMAQWPQIHQVCLDALAAVPSCPPALWALADFYACIAEAAAEHVRQLYDRGPSSVDSEPAVPPDLGPGVAALHAAVNNACLLLDGLTMADPIRSMYWVHRHQQLQRLAGGWQALDVGVEEGGGGDAAGAAGAGDGMQDAMQD